MYAVKLSTPAPDWPFARQTPGQRGIWGDYRFFENEDIEACDFWVVYDGLLKEETARCPKGRTILITGEPPSVKRYAKGYLAQFAAVVTCQREIRHGHAILSHPAQPWHVGRCVRNDESVLFTKGYDELTELGLLKKERLISVITSNKTITSGHRKRLEFVRALKDHFGDAIDLFGRGIRDVEDKWDAIAPYQYHVVLENTRYPDYWTEKLADCYLAGAYPFYYGCPDLDRYFSPESYTAIDLDDPKRAIAAIEKALAENVFDRRRQALAEAKVAVLNEHNLYPVITRVCDSLQGASVKEPVRIRPEKAFRNGFSRVCAVASRLKDRLHG